MTREEYELLCGKEPFITVDTLSNTQDRILLYGYTFNRDTFSLILRDGEIYQQLNGETVKTSFTNNEEYLKIGDGLKRLYPEKCDYEFCKCLMILGYDLPFTTFS
jgi:hypothetical protein